MASYNYQEIIKQAKSCTKNVNETYKLGISANGHIILQNQS